jgi:hypothetical protein
MYGSITDTMNIIKRKEKRGKHLNTLEKYHIRAAIGKYLDYIKKEMLA